MNKPFAVLSFALLAAVAVAQSPPILPDMPRHGYVLDRADLLSNADVASINHISAEAKRDHSAPIVVVTIRSLDEMHASGMSVDDYAHKLFNAWQIGNAVSNKGVLILVDKDDRKARIEMGGGWGHSKDDEASQIMQESMIPQFKAGDYGGGVRAAVQSIHRVVAGQSVTQGGTPWDSGTSADSSDTYPSYSSSGDLSSVSGTLCFCPFIIFFIIVAGVASSARSGFRRRYYPGGFWGGGWGGPTNNFFMGGLGSSSGSSGMGSSGFSGGSDFSGGGSSGGGGASGSW